MSNLNSRINKLEGQQPPADRPAWADLQDDGRAVLHYQDGARVEVEQDAIPAGTKTYKGISPEDWDKVTK